MQHWRFTMFEVGDQGKVTRSDQREAIEDAQRLVSELPISGRQMEGSCRQATTDPELAAAREAVRHAIDYFNSEAPLASLGDDNPYRDAAYRWVAAHVLAIFRDIVWEA